MMLHGLCCRNFSVTAFRHILRLLKFLQIVEANMECNISVQGLESTFDPLDVNSGFGTLNLEP
jgi:hypothetical protein